MAPTAISLFRDGVETSIFASTPGGAMKIDATGDVSGWDLFAGNVGIDIVGHGGNEQQIGTAANDRLFGGAGADNLFGQGGNDTLVGGLGIDLMFGNAGADTFRYDFANESFFSTGYDTIADFETGQDVINLASLNPSALSLVRAGGNTFVFGAFGSELFEIAVGGVVQGSDLLTTRGIDNVGLNGPDDLLIGTGLTDRLFGQGGNDTLRGGGGADQLFGGAGFDTFKYAAASESTAAARDFIADFETGIDKIDLRGLGVTAANVGISGVVVFVNAPGGAMQIGIGSPIALADILTGPAPRLLDSDTPEPLDQLMSAGFLPSVALADFIV